MHKPTEEEIKLMQEACNSLPKMDFGDDPITKLAEEIEKLPDKKKAFELIMQLSDVLLPNKKYKPEEQKKIDNVKCKHCNDTGIINNISTTKLSDGAGLSWETEFTCLYCKGE